MRQSYHEELNAVVSTLVDMTDDVRKAVADATHALLGADAALAARVIGDDPGLDERHDAMEERCFSLLARQAPVAGELRTVVAALRMAFELARMGDLAVHIAKIAAMRTPMPAVPDLLRENFLRMAQVADGMIEVAGTTLADRDVDKATLLADSDEEMDDLRRQQFEVLLGGDWPYGVEAAVDVALLGRYYERIADHAVSMGRRIIYLVTGASPGGQNWPNA